MHLDYSRVKFLSCVKKKMYRIHKLEAKLSPSLKAQSSAKQLLVLPFGPTFILALPIFVALTLVFKSLAACLVHVFKHMFSIFK